MSAATGTDVFIAESQEPHYSYADPSGLAPSARTEVRLHVVEGVFSTYANAEAALDNRLARFRGVEVLGQFEQSSLAVDGPRSWTREVRWDAMGHPEGDQVCWQQVKRVKIDEHSS